jgi:hypothetical protein
VTTRDERAKARQQRAILMTVRMDDSVPPEAPPTVGSRLRLLLELSENQWALARPGAAPRRLDRTRLKIVRM